MKKEPLHNMLDAVLSGSDNNAQLHFHNYLKTKFRSMIGKTTSKGNSKTELKETDYKN